MLDFMVWLFLNRRSHGDAMNNAIDAAKHHLRVGPRAKVKPGTGIFSFRISTKRIAAASMSELRILEELRAQGIVDISWWEEDTWSREVHRRPLSVHYVYTSKWAEYTLIMSTSMPKIKLRAKALVQTQPFS